MRDGIDVIIPVYKPDEKLYRLLCGLLRQTRLPNRIIILKTVDHTEQDAWCEALLKRVRSRTQRGAGIRTVEVSVYSIAKASFDHGGTRRYGVSQSDAAYFVCMTQDAVPKDERLLEGLLAGFSDETTAVSYARQLAGRDSGAAEALVRAFNYPERSVRKSKADIQTLGIKTYFCSDVCAAYRRDYYDALGGFVSRTIFNEDMIFAAAAIKAGYSVYYAAEAQVIHSHRYGYVQQLRRSFDLAVSHAEFPEVFASLPSEKEGLRMTKTVVCRLIKSGHCLEAMRFVLDCGLRYLGYFLGLRFRWLPKRLVLVCTGTKDYFR